MIRELYSFLSQSCEADFVLMSAGKGMDLILTNYIGKVNILRVRPRHFRWPFQPAASASNEVEEKIYPRFDLTAIRLAIEMGRHMPVAMKVVTRDGEKMTYEITGASKDKKTGKETFSVKPVSESLIPALGLGAITGASIEIIGPIAYPALPDLPMTWPTTWSWNAANQKLILPGDNRDYYAIANKLPVANKVPVVFEATRVGSTKKEKMVSNVSSYKVSGNNIELNLSRKGLKSKGDFAGNAVTGFSSGDYTIHSIRLLPTHDKVCLLNDYCSDYYQSIKY